MAGAEPWAQRGGPTRRRILVAYDGTDRAFQALEQAADDAERTGAGICVVTVGPELGRTGLAKAPGLARRYLVDRGLRPEVHAPVGDPATEIVRVARECGCDVILLGTRDGPIGRAIGSGSIGEGVVTGGARSSASRTAAADGRRASRPAGALHVS